MFPVNPLNLGFESAHDEAGACQSLAGSEGELGHGAVNLRRKFGLHVERDARVGLRHTARFPCQIRVVNTSATENIAKFTRITCKIRKILRIRDIHRAHHWEGAIPMRAQTAAVAVPSQVPSIAAIFNLDDPAERRIIDVIRRFFTDPPDIDALCDIGRGMRVVDGAERRTVWTLSRFQPQRRGAKPEWSVISWDIDVIECRFHPCKNQQEARLLFADVVTKPAVAPGVSP